MKKLSYLLLLLVLVSACREDDIVGTQQIQMENLYTVTDDPDNPVQHRIYEIYEQYGVPVFYNDTIGQVQIGNDVNGNPYYRYETLDLGWDFDSYNRATYLFDYITDPDEQLAYLDAVEYYLEHSSKNLWPYAFFIVNGVTTISRDGKNTISEESREYLINFRLISLVTSNWGPEPTDVMDNLKREYVMEKISIFTTDVDAFGAVSKKYYSTYYDILHTTYGTAEFGEPFPGASYGIGTVITRMGDVNLDLVFGTAWDWIYETESKRAPSLTRLIRYLYNGEIRPTVYGDMYSDEELAILWRLGHYAVGTFGFVSSSTRSIDSYSPDDVSDDLKGYLKVILNTTDEEFREEWGALPLVMEKYEILYRVLTEELGLEL